MKNEILDCPFKNRCGSCDYIGESYKSQLSKKKDFIKKLFKDEKINEIIGMDNPYNYRNKVHMAFDTDKKNNIISGLYEVSTHKIVKVDNCLLDDKIADKIILDIKNLMPKYNLTAYSEFKNRGLLRHVLIKRSFTTNETMVVLVLTCNKFNNRDEFTKELVSLNKEITTIIININSEFTSMILGEHESILYGPGYIKDELCGLKFRISSKSFYQVNPVQAEKLYNFAIESAKITRNDIVLDAYSGTGTIGLIASKYAKKILSVELNREAVKDAIENAKENNIKNITFIQNDATKYINKIAFEKEKIDCVIMDPPRTGSTKEFMHSLIKLSPRTIVYISCNPVTLKRDLDYFLSFNKYKIDTIQPIDMFPQTTHVECIVLLQRK